MRPDRIVAQYVLEDAGGYRWAVQRGDGQVALGAVLYQDATEAARRMAATVAAYGGRLQAAPVVAPAGVDAA
jgi:hypothetical protein